MGYIGNEPTTGHFPVDNLTSSGGSTYTLSKAPASAGAIEVSVQGILQPTTAYTVSGTTLTLAGVASGVNIFVRHLGETLSLPTPADGSVTTSKIADDAIDSDHYVDGSVDNAHLATGIDAAKITTGTLSNSRLSGVGLLATDQSWSGSQRGTPSTVTDGTLDLNTANNFDYTPAGADDLEFSNETAGQTGFIKLINPSAHAISVGSEVKKGTSWDVSTAGTYLVSYYCDGTNVYVSASEALS